MVVYNKNYLLQQLEKEGLTHSRAKIIELEKKGVIKKGSVEIELYGRTRHKWHYYTKEDVDTIIEVVREYGDKRRTTP